MGYDRFVADIEEGEKKLKGLMEGQKFFRFPFYNEGERAEVRDRVRGWLKEHGYRNLPGSIDNEDPVYSSAIQEARAQGKKIDFDKVKAVFIDHIVEGAEFAEKLSQDVLGYSPKHIILLHDKDATVLFLEDLVAELRQRGWTFISAAEAIKDPLYSMEPKNLQSNYGLLAQVAYEKQGKYTTYFDFKKMRAHLKDILGLK